MTLRESLITVFDAYVAAGRVGRARLSTIVFGSGMRFDRILEGSDVSTGTFERAMLWLSTNWPDGAEWPAGVARPAPAEISPEAAE